MDISTQTRKAIDAAYDFRKVICQLTGMSMVSDTLVCPFHGGDRKNAKLYSDQNGDKIFCFTESKQYTVTDFLILKNQDLSKWIPVGFVPVEEDRRPLDYAQLDGFKKGEFGIEEFCIRLMRLTKI